MTERLQYECVICTRNRPAALRMSIPRLLGQTRPPRRVIIADSSDDKAAVRAAVAEASADSTIEVLMIDCERGSSVQRNVGLGLVEAPVVIFPDDDSLCDPDYAEKLMEVYERDTEGLIGCVNGSPRRELVAAGGAPEAATLGWADRLRQRTSSRRVKLERRFVLDPLISIGEDLERTWATPPWLSEFEGELNSWVRGFRMSFRTSAIRRAGGFDETLRNYSTFEDTAAGLTVARTHLIFQCRSARVFHNQAAGGRGSGRVRGATNIANRAYVVACQSAPGSVHRRRALSYGAYRCCLYAVGSLWSSYHRDAFRGAIAVLVRIRRLLRASPAGAASEYRSLLAAARVMYD